MKKISIVIVFIIFIGFVFFLARNGFQKHNPDVPAGDNQNYSQNILPAPALPESKNISSAQKSNGFQPPLDRATERVTKKPFGIYIIPKTSPVQPERFRGYHTGMDFEIFPEESNIDMPVRAVCSGKIAMKRFSSGYGGTLVQNCMLDNQPITVIYGHLKLTSITKNADDTLNAGDGIGILGKAYSSETDGERKHLHLGIHKGSAINIRGYVNTEAELSGWIDACLYACK